MIKKKKKKSQLFESQTPRRYVKKQTSETSHSLSKRGLTSGPSQMYKEWTFPICPLLIK